MNTRSILLGSIALILASAVPVRAATQFWDGDQSIINSASDNTSTAAMSWLNGGNWDNGTASGPLAAWPAGDVAVFGGSFAGNQTVTLGSPITAGGVDIGSGYTILINTGVFNSFGVPSGPITIGPGSRLSADSPANNAHNIAAGAGLTLNGGTLTSINGTAGPANDGGFGNWLLRGPVTVGGSSASAISSTTLVLNSGGGLFTVADATASAASDLIVSAAIIPGAAGLVKDGAGTMELTAANTFTQALTINAGTLRLAPTASLLGSVTANASGRLTLVDSAAVAGTLTAAAGGTIAVENTGAASLAKVIAGAGTFAKAGPGDLSVGNGILTQTGGTTVEAGSLIVTRTGGATISMPLTIKAGASFRIGGNQFNNFIVPGGTITPATPGITVENGATLEAAGTANNANNITGLILKGGTVLNTGTPHPVFATFIPRYITVSDFPSTINLPRLGFLGVAFPLDVADTPGPIDLDILGPVFSGDGSGSAGGLVKTGPGTVRFQSNVSLNNPVVVQGGTVNATNAAIVTTFGGYNVTAATLHLHSTSPGAKLTDGQTVTIGAGGTVRITGTEYNTVFGQNWNLDNGATLTFDNTAFNANNAGAVTLKGGTITTAGTPDPDYAHLIVSGGITVQDNPSTWSADLGLNGAQTIFVAETGADVDFLVAGRLRGNGPGAHGFTKTGPGKMRISDSGASGDYGGSATIANGILEVFNSSASGRSPLSPQPLTIQAGATVTLIGDNYNVLGTAAAMPATITIQTGGTLTASNSVKNAHNIANLTLDGGTLHATNASHDGFGNFIINGALTQTSTAPSLITAPAIAFRAPGGTASVADTPGLIDLQISSALLDHGGISSLTKTGPGTLLLTGPSTYTGPTTIAEGSLLLTGTLTGSSGVSISGAPGFPALLGGTGTITTPGAITLGGDGILSPGTSAGTLALSALAGMNISLGVAPAASGALRFELGPIGASDLISLQNGALDIGNGILEAPDFMLTALSGLQIGTYTLIDTSLPIIGSLGPNVTGFTGAFTGSTLQISPDGQDVLLVVPEPAGAALILVGLALTATRRRHTAR